MAETREPGRWAAYVKGAASIGHGMVSIFSFGQMRVRDPEVEAILARSDAEALYGDWLAIGGDIAKAGTQVGVNMTWFSDEVRRAKTESLTMAEMQARLLAAWYAHLATEAKVS